MTGGGACGRTRGTRPTQKTSLCMDGGGGFFGGMLSRKRCRGGIHTIPSEKNKKEEGNREMRKTAKTKGGAWGRDLSKQKNDTTDIVVRSDGRRGRKKKINNDILLKKGEYQMQHRKKAQKSTSRS